VTRWGRAGVAHWFNLDRRRSGKDKALVIRLDARVMPVITPDDPGRVAEELTAHGVRVRLGNW
jgi:hypothetical protein